MVAETTRMHEIQKKNAAFGLKRFPISIWNYTNLAEHGRYMTEAEMDSLADAGRFPLAVEHVGGPGANGVSWFFWYMKQPHCNYRLSPVDKFWEKTQGYYDIRRVQKNFHRLYGDLFNRLVSTRVRFFSRAYGGGQLWRPNELVSEIWPAYNNELPVLIGEFADAAGARYVMFVNNSMTENDRIKITFPKNVRLFSRDWNGQERQGPAYAVDTVEKSENGQVLWHWLSPGQEAVYRIQVGN